MVKLFFNDYLIHLPLFLTVALLLTLSCRRDTSVHVSPESSFEAFIRQSDSCMVEHDAEGALQASLSALAVADSTHLPLLRMRAHNSIAVIDVATSRDSQAWIHAVTAEELARIDKCGSELAKALTVKGNICLYAEVSEDYNRNDEAETYFTEALAQAELCGDRTAEAEVYFGLSQLYVNRNRWTDPLNRTIWNQAEEFLSKGQMIAAEYTLKKQYFNGLRYRVRLLRQGGKYEEAAECCHTLINQLPEDDYLSLYQMYDQLTAICLLCDDPQGAIDSHNQSMDYVQRYIHGKADEVFQEMETRYTVELKNAEIAEKGMKITILVLSLAFSLIAVAFLTIVIYRVREKNKSLRRQNDIKEELLAFLSKDLKNPSASRKARIRDFVRDCQSLDEDEIRHRSEALLKDIDTLNEDVAEYLSATIIHRNRTAKDYALTKREMEILQLSGRGLSAREIADKLFLSLRTVNNHKANIFSKMGVNSTTELIIKAREIGLLHE